MKKEEAPLIHEKITAPEQSVRVSRTRLLKLLGDNLSAYNATIINGRAGTGKTALAADFARHSGRAFSWYKVDAADSDFRVFCEYLLSSIRLQRLSVDSDRVLELIEKVEDDGAEPPADALVFQLSESRSEPLLIVIEDLHLVYDAEWVVPFFRRLLPLLPTDVHLLITCRSLPPSPWWRLRSKQMLRVVDESELAFTLDEAVALFKTYGLGKEHAQVAWSQSKGRAAAIAELAATPERTGRTTADSFLAIRHPSFKCLTRAPDFQT